MSATISMTYDIRTEESTREGDVSEHGFCEPGGWEYPLGTPEIDREIKEHPELYWKPVKAGDLRAAISTAQEWGCTQDNGNGSFYSVDLEIDYATGEERSRAVHFDGFTPSTLARIGRAICS